MHYQLVLLSFILYVSCVCSKNEEEDDTGEESDLGGKLVSQLRNDANLDLSVDEEYEDLRAELLAYHTALASIASRRSLLTTPCWQMGGICVHHKLCEGSRFITQVPGCKDKLNVCCFRWNELQVRDMREKGISSLGLPWAIKYEFGGKGVQDQKRKKEKIGRVQRSSGYITAGY